LGPVSGWFGLGLATEWVFVTDALTAAEALRVRASRSASTVCAADARRVARRCA